MKLSRALPLYLALLSGGFAAANDKASIDEALVKLAAEKTDIEVRMQSLAPLIRRAEQAIKPYSHSNDEYDIVRKWDRQRLLNVIINDNWKLFNILEAIDVLSGSNAEGNLVNKLQSALQKAITIQKKYCPKKNGEIQIEDSGDVKNIQHECYAKTKEAGEYFEEQLSLIGPDSGFRRKWKYMQDFLPFNARDLLRLMIEKKPMRNDEWLRWFVQETEGISPKNLFNWDEDTALQLLLVRDWGTWSRTYMKYNRPNPPPKDGRVEYPTNDAKLAAEKFVKKRISYNYHLELVICFQNIVGAALPDIMQVGEELIADLTRLIQGGATIEEMQAASAVHLAKIKNSPERDQRLGFKKSKGLDAKVALASTRVGRVNPTDPYSFAKHNYPVFEKAAKIQDPKLHPADRDYWITNVIRKALEMDVRKAPSRMKEPKADDKKGISPSEGRTQNVEMSGSNSNDR